MFLSKKKIVFHVYIPFKMMWLLPNLNAEISVYLSFIVRLIGREKINIVIIEPESEDVVGK